MGNQEARKGETVDRLALELVDRCHLHGVPLSLHDKKGEVLKSCVRDYRGSDKKGALLNILHADLGCSAPAGGLIDPRTICRIVKTVPFERLSAVAPRA